MAELGGEAGGDRDRARRAACRRRTPRSRTRCSATGSTSTTPTRTRSRTSAPWSSPAAAALAEARGASGRELLTAIIAGQRDRRRGSGWRRRAHSTSAASTRRRSAGSSARRRRRPGWAGSTPPTTTSALGIAGSMASGLFAYLDDATATKPIHPAWAAHGALLAARLAAHGAEGPPGVLEGRFGVFHAFVDTRDRPRAASSPTSGSRWETPRIAYKAVPGLPLHPRLARRDGDAAATGSTRTRSRTSS